MRGAKERSDYSSCPTRLERAPTKLELNSYPSKSRFEISISVNDPRTAYSTNFTRDSRVAQTAKVDN